MKLLAIGLGSMGKRRIKLIKSYFKREVEIAGVDINDDRRKGAKDLYNIKTYSELEEAIYIEKPNGVLICTSPSSHSEIILKCLNKKLHVFTEINLIKDKYEEIMNLSKRNNLKLFLSSTFLYRKEIQYIYSEVHNTKGKVYYRYHVGQYLPDWHPWENYKEFFVSKKSTNGCREIFAIELPWIIRVFGKVISYKVVKDNISSLEIDYSDTYLVMLEHENGYKGVLNVDIVSRKPVRSLEIYSEELHLFWEGTPESLMKYNIDTKETNHIETYPTVQRDNNYAENIIENAYLEELNVFISKILGKESIERYTFEDDLYTLELIDKIEGVHS